MVTNIHGIYLFVGPVFAPERLPVIDAFLTWLNPAIWIWIDLDLRDPSNVVAE